MLSPLCYGNQKPTTVTSFLSPPNSKDFFSPSPNRSDLSQKTTPNITKISQEVFTKSSSRRREVTGKITESLPRSVSRQSTAEIEQAQQLNKGGKKLFNDKKYKEALGKFEEVVGLFREKDQKSQSLATALCGMGACHETMRQTRKAIDCFRNAAWVCKNPDEKLLAEDRVSSLLDIMEADLKKAQERAQTSMPQANKPQTEEVATATSPKREAVSSAIRSLVFDLKNYESITEGKKPAAEKLHGLLTQYTDGKVTSEEVLKYVDGELLKTNNPIFAGRFTHKLEGLFREALNLLPGPPQNKEV